MDADQIQWARATYDLLHAIDLWLPLAWLALVGLAVAAAPDRRRLLFWLGVGCFVVTLGFGLRLLFARSYVVGSVPFDAADVARSVWTILASRLRASVYVELVLAGGAWYAGRRSGARPTEPVTGSG